MKTPSFWSRRDSPLSLALLPLSLLYRLGHDFHQRGAAPYTPSVPVLCLGNIVAGGSGKTPAALSVAALLTRHGIAARPFFLSRGYGGALSGPVQIDSTHTAAATGDEPLLLARVAPTIIAADRAAGARLAEQNGAGIIVMDDGLQNPGIAKTLKFVVIDGVAGFGNRRLLPAGPLRAPLPSGLAAADAFIVIGGEVPPEAAATGKPVFTAAVETSWRPAETPYIAFCGLGRPEKFFTTLESAGAHIAARRAFADHHPYTDKDLDALTGLSREHGARLVTTEKDAVRLPPSYSGDVVPVTIRWHDESALISFLRTKIKKV